jgi:hypothetical protein
MPRKMRIRFELRNLGRTTVGVTTQNSTFRISGPKHNGSNLGNSLSHIRERWRMPGMMAVLRCKHKARPLIYNDFIEIRNLRGHGMFHLKFSFFTVAVFTSPLKARVIISHRPNIKYTWYCSGDF